MKRIGIIGVGRVGAVIAKELSMLPGLEVATADTSPEALDSQFIKDFTTKVRLPIGASYQSELNKFVMDQELLVNCVPGKFGYSTLEQIIAAKRPAVDISFFPENSAPLKKLAKKNGVEAWIDMGLAPGMTNIVGARLAQQKQCENLDLYVGGLPVARSYPLQYKAVFSPSDVIEEYVRPSRIKRGDKILTVAPLTEPEFLEIAGVGTLEAFVTDGLRTLVESLDVPNMREMTLRYPGHRAFMASLKELGFFNSAQRSLASGAKSSPLEMTESVLADSWTLAPEELDRTVFVAKASFYDGSIKTVEMIDLKDTSTGYSSMARTTGFVAAAAVSFLSKNGKIHGPGVFAPERICEHEEAFQWLLNFLSERNVNYQGLR